MTASGHVKIMKDILLDLFYSYFSTPCVVMGRSYPDIFSRNAALAPLTGRPNILCSGRAQVLHSLLTEARTLSASSAVTTGIRFPPLITF
jgi:hypothetical protein